MASTVPCTTPAHGVKNHVAGSKAAIECTGSSTTPAHSFEAPAMTPASREAEPFKEDISPENKVYLASVKAAMAASAEKQEWDNNLDRRSVTRHRISSYMTDFLAQRDGGIRSYFNVVAHVQNVLHRNDLARRDSVQNVARRKVERERRDTLILEAVQNQAPMPESLSQWSIENAKKIAQAVSPKTYGAVNPRRR